MTLTTDARIAIATEAFEAGFTSKAAQKRALDELNRAYSAIQNAHHGRAIDVAPHQQSDANWYEGLSPEQVQAVHNERGEYFAQWEIPFDLHNVRDRHVELIAKLDAGQAHTVIQLIDLRAALKAAPIVAVERETLTAREKAIAESIHELMARRGEQYNRALGLAEIFGGLPVHANVHLVTNQHGSTFLRAFYYLAGEFTPLQVILAAADELARRKEEA